MLSAADFFLFGKRLLDVGQLGQQGFGGLLRALPVAVRVGGAIGLRLFGQLPRAAACSPTRRCIVSESVARARPSAAAIWLFQSGMVTSSAACKREQVVSSLA